MTGYEYLNLIASYGGLVLIFYGIRVMDKNASMRAADSERKHAETMTESRHRHDEAMADSGRRHTETMAESGRRHDEAMTALRELIERTR